MALVLVTADRWTPITHDWEIFIRADALTDNGYTVRVEVAAEPLEVRCLHPLPAGFWLRMRRRALDVEPEVVELGGGVAQWRPFDTETFRRAETGEFARPEPGGHRQRIWPDDHRGEQQ